jgi:hypothetical protein
MESPIAPGQDPDAHGVTGARPSIQKRTENTMALMRSEIEWIVVRICVVAIAATMLVVPAASGAQHASAAGGISTQTLAFVSNVESGDQLVVMRITFEPGVTLPAHSHPGSASFVVMAGTLQTTLVRGGAAVNRNGNEQVAEIGATMNLSAGQVITYSPDAAKTVANHGSQPLVLIATMLLDPNEPMVTFMDWPPIFQPSLQ